jgi:PAS domain S-box-containing protein
MADQPLVKRIQTRIVIYAAVGMLAVGGIASLVGILPLAAQLRKAQEKNLQIDLRRQTRAVESYVARARNASMLRLNRGNLREGMAAYAAGQISREEIRDMAESRLLEGTTFSSNSVGITLLDIRTNVLVETGAPIPRELWFIPDANARDATLTGPVRIGQEFFMISSGPILSRQGERVGTDLVLYRLAMLRLMIEDYSEHGSTGETIVGDLSNRELPIFFPFRNHKRSAQEHPKLKTEAVRKALELAQQGKTGLMTPDESPDPSLVMAYGPVEGADWGVVVKRTASEFYGPINRRLAGLGLVIGGLILLGTFGVVMALKPLAGRMIIHTDELESQVYEKTAALNTELAERKRAEISARDSEALYHSLVDTLPINILRKDLQGRVTYGNKGYCDAMGKPFSELKGKTDFELFPKDLASKYAADDDKVITTGAMFEDIEEHRKPDGDRRYVHVLKAPVRDARREIVGTQVIFWDVTARKLAEEQLSRTAADLARSNQELEQFAYVASHDLQEPLRMITSYTQLIAKRYGDKLDNDAREFINFAVDGAQRMQRLINDLLAYSRVGSKGKPLEPVAGGDCLKAALDNLKVAIEEGKASVTFDELPEVLGDSVQLTQLFQNLIGNALKFRGKSPARIHIGAKRRLAPSCPVPTTQAPLRQEKPEEWEFSVRDNGIGIEPQYYDRIFVIFQRLHTQDQYPGTGIGLAICKKIVERHGGRLWVESKAGEGTTFFFSLPALPGGRA